MYLKLGLPDIIVIFIDILVYNGAILLLSVFSKNAVTVQGVVFHFDYVFFLISLALVVSCNIVIGRYLGAKQ